ncbi:MAG: AbrB family transcriptional regulator [Streptococcaceae bacterium]|jgi:hypothetical protein|nr:AbrB family transcriptional regulator [Streptococcaceae bacterium]
MITKTRKQGNSLALTVPKIFQIPEDIAMEPELRHDGIFYRFVETQTDFFDFSKEVLSDILEEGLTDKDEILKEFVNRQVNLQVVIDKMVERASEYSSKTMTRSEIEAEIGL